MKLTKRFCISTIQSIWCILHGINQNKIKSYIQNVCDNNNKIKLQKQKVNKTEML